MDSALSFLEDIIHKTGTAISNRDFYVERFGLSMIDLLSSSIVTFLLEEVHGQSQSIQCGLWVLLSIKKVKCS